jgi:pentose-5-phosphate-3-epimerase
MRQSAAVTLAAWHTRLPPNILGGSLFAVESAARGPAALALFENGCGIHADIMINGDGAISGLTGEELRIARAEAPDGVIDAHIMFLGHTFTPAVDAAVRTAIASAVAVDVVRLAASRSIIDRFRTELEELRSQGVRVWIDIAPGDDGVSIDRDRVDGALVMFIEPGSTDAADARNLDKLAMLSSFMPVGADGGIAAHLCDACLDAGATYVVSGRALLRATHPVITTHKEEINL